MSNLSLHKKILPILLCTILLFGCASPNAQTNSDFEAFTTTLFINEIATNTLSLQYTLESPEFYGIANAPITLGEFQTTCDQALLQAENYLAALSLFSYQDLTKENQLTYDVLFRSLDNTIQLSDYPLYDEPLSPYTGIHTQLPILLSEFSLRDSHDVELYLDLLETVPAYFNSLIDYQKEKVANGLFMSDHQLETVISDCNAYLTVTDDYLNTSFFDRISVISSIDATQKTTYISQNDALVKDVVLPAYQNLITELSKLKGSGTNSHGLFYHPQGVQYYELLASISTGSTRTIPEIQQLIQSQIANDFTAIQDLLLDSSFNLQDFDAVPPLSPEEILKDLQSHTEISFPTYPSVHTTIKSVPTEMEPYLSPAFYLLPTIDNTTTNIIYINNQHLGDPISLYSTLAHESYPGHLYQTTYFDSTDPDPLRQSLSFGGYVEGWATYSEMCSFYFSDFSPELNTFIQKNNSLTLGLFAYADIGIHYEGWQLDDMTAFLSHYGITDESSISRTYNLIIATPSNYLKYYLGYIEILELKKKCIDAWGDEFTQEKFHKAVLDIGPTPFDLLEEYVLG